MAEVGKSTASVAEQSTLVGKRRVGSVELSLVLSLTVIGGGLRGYRLGDIGLSHFDEGIYALSGLWPYTGGFESNQGLYSPPIFPFLVGLCNLAIGSPTDTAAFLVNWFFGTLTVPLVWWIARSWWSVPAGIAAAGAIAVDGFSIAFSRMALTDATFNFAFLLAMYLVFRAMDSRSVADGLLAGLAVGFTWNIKYNGFLPLVLSVGFLVPWIGISRIELRRRFEQFARICFVAIACYLPWAAWFHMKQPGGYPALIDHQRGYWAGPKGATTGMDRFPKYVAVFPSVLCPIPERLAIKKATPYSRCLWIWLLVVPVLGAFGSRLPPPVLCCALGAALLVPAMYTFYVRLWLPTYSLDILAIAGFVFPAAHSMVIRVTRMSMAKWHRIGIVLTATWLLWAGKEVVHSSNPWENWQPDAVAGYRMIIPELSDWKELNRFQSRTLCGFVRPPLVYYMATNGIDFQRLAGGRAELDSIPKGAILLVDTAAKDSPQFSSAFEDARTHFKLAGNFLIELPLAAKLDDMRPEELAMNKRQFHVSAYEKL